MYYLKIQKCTIYTFHPLPHFPVQIFRNQPFVSSLDSFSHSSSPFSLFRNSPRSRREWFWRKVEYLEIEVYRTTPLVPDDGLVGDNRASESFRVCNFLRRSVQSPRFFRLLSIERREIQADHVLLSLSPFFPSLSPPLSLSLSTLEFPTRRLLADEVSLARSLQPPLQHPRCTPRYVPAGIRYTIADTARFVVARA